MAVSRDQIHYGEQFTSNEADRHCTYNVEARSHNHCCCGKGINITYSEFVSVASVIQPSSTHELYYIVVWFVRLYHIYSHYLIHGTILGKNLLNIKCVF